MHKNRPLAEGLERNLQTKLNYAFIISNLRNKDKGGKRVNYYLQFYNMISRFPDMKAIHVYSSICQAIADSPFTTKQDLIDVTKAYDEYKEELNNERIIATVSAS